MDKNALCCGSFKVAAKTRKVKWLSLSENLWWLKENWLEVILESQSALLGSQTTAVITRNVDSETPREDSVTLNRFYLEIWTQTQLRENPAGFTTLPDSIYNAFAVQGFSFSAQYITKLLYLHLCK